MNRFSLLLVYSILLISYCGCKKPGCIGSPGNMSSQERILTPFNQIILSDNIDLELIQDGAEKIEIIAPENIIPNIQAFISEDILTLSNETDCRWMRSADEKIKVRLHFKDIRVIDYQGSGTISNADTLRLHALSIASEKGAGDIELTLNAYSTNVSLLKENMGLVLHGTTEYAGVYSSARAQLNISDFTIKNMQIIYSGLADTYIHVTDNLDATIRYKGNVYYKGAPAITRSDYFSSGRLIKNP